MIPICPKCKNKPSDIEWPTLVEINFTYACCGQRRHYYYDDFHGWESQKARQDRLRVKIVCNHCGTSFTISNVQKEKGKQRSTCDKCHAEIQRLNHQGRGDYEQVPDI